MTTATAPLTRPEDFLLTDEGKGFEYIDGQLEEKPVSALSSYVGAQVNRLVGNHVTQKKLGIVLQSDGSYRCFL